MGSEGAVPEVTVLSGGALREVVDELGEAFAKAGGRKVAAEFATSAAVHDRILAGECFDIVISTQAAIADLTERQKLDASSAAIVARSGIGVAVQASRPRPDIGSVAAFVDTLRHASSIACADPAYRTPSGLFLAGLFERLGLTAELKPKLQLIGATGGKPVVVCEVVASGKAELGLQQVSEIMAVSGVDLVGPLPAELQHLTTFAAAVTSAAPNAQAARDFIAFLASEKAKPAIVRRGMQPG
jgi:molybdate transport system substrate-binding protein